MMQFRILASLALALLTSCSTDDLLSRGSPIEVKQASSLNVNQVLIDSAAQVRDEIKRINNIREKGDTKKSGFTQNTRVTFSFNGTLRDFVKALNGAGISSRIVGEVPAQDYLLSLKYDREKLATVIDDVAAQLPESVSIKIKEGGEGEITFVYPLR